jgi:hypothetical protein
MGVNGCPLRLYPSQSPVKVSHQSTKAMLPKHLCYRYAPVSILREMLAGLLFWGFIGEVAALQALHRYIGRGQQGAEGRCEHRIGLERIQSSIQTRGQPLNAALRSLCVTEVPRVDIHWRTWIELVADAIEPGGEQASHGQIGIAAVVDRFEFQVGGLDLAAPEG